MRISVRKCLPITHYLYYGFTCLLLLVCVQLVKGGQGQPPIQHDTTGANKQSQPEPSPVVSPSPSQPTIEQPKAVIETQKGQEQPKSSFWETKLTDWIQVGINAVLLVVVFWQAKINRDQRITMQEQNEIMQRELDITRDSVTQNERALGAVESQAETAKQSVQIARETFYIGERPYFGVEGMELEGLRAGNVPVLSLKLMNGGQTPAWHFRVTAFLIMGIAVETGDKWPFMQSSEHISQRFVPAGTTIDLVFKILGKNITEAQADVIWSSSIKTFVAVTARYSDMRGEKHSDNFVVIFDPKTGLLRDWIE